MPLPRHLLIVDDDLLTREVLSAVAEEAGFTVSAFDSGEGALAHLALHRASPPSALLVDMQMPGLHGNALALRLRPACVPATLLIAMSGSAVPPQAHASFDSFLLKPFDFPTFLAALEHAPPLARPQPPAQEVLAEATYLSLAHSMPAQQLRALYELCLGDAETRMHKIHQAALAGDDDAFRRGAHSIKGGCGMVGAMELAALASAMEEDGPPDVGNLDALEKMSDQFMRALSRLRSILEARAEQFPLSD